MKHNEINHMWLMVFACAGALLLIIVLQFLGISKNWAAGVSIAAMIIMHLWMMRGRSDKSYSEPKEHKGGTK